MKFSITSTAFLSEMEIPKRYTCDGENISPPLSWEGVPDNTKSLVLILDDPDVPDPRNPENIWTHWIIYNIPPSVRGLGEGVDLFPDEVLFGSNDWRKTEYRGPCPPSGRHRYYFKLYALNTVLPDLNKPKVSKLEDKMMKHVISSAILMGTYEKKNN